MKLYPPYIEEKLPAFIKENNQATIVVPYILNPTVGRNDFKKIQLKLRTTQDKEIGYFDTENIDNGVASFVIEDNGDINSTQFYKAQIAFVSNDDQIGMFSSVGIVKCVNNATASIKVEGDSPYYYIGGFTGTVDLSNNAGEKIQQYCFTLTDSFGQVQETSGWLNHDNSKDTDTDTWIPKTYLIPNEEYSVKYEVITNNLYKISSNNYTVKNVEAEKLEDDTIFWTKIYPIPEKGKMVIHLFKLNLNSFELQPIDCQFRILRRQVDTEAWIELFNSTTHIEPVVNTGRFSTTIPPQVKIIDFPLPYIFEDYTMEQGVSYEYAVQEVKDGINRKKKIICNRPVKADFEDMFLYDGKAQLRIAFNPKVSSFKTTILESKHDTIGGKYPFFFRNGDVNYKEFPISGLISINMDEEFFQSKFANSILDSEDGLGNQQRRSKTHSTQAINPIVGTNLTGDIIRTEREYKLAVLDWLNDGKPKLFRSPTEGNYLVRLMNVSLTPNDTLGRMIHTFSATAYEVGPADTQSLISSGFLGQINTPSDFTLQSINMEG